MEIAVYILVVLSICVLAAQGKPYQIINGPETLEFNNHIGRVKYNIVRNEDRLHYRPHHIRYSSPSAKPWADIKHFDTSPVTVQAGSSVEITCEVKGGPPPQVLWLEDNHDLEKQIEEHERQSDAKTSWSGLSTVISKYVIDCATPEHHQKAIHCASIAGQTVQLSDKVQILVEGTNSTDCENRLSKPIITTFAQTTLAPQGTMVMLPCRAIGNPKPYTYWVNKVTGQRIYSDDKYSDKDVRLLPDGSLLFTDLSWDEMGSYECVAVNYIGKSSVESFVYPLARSNDLEENEVQSTQDN